MAKKKKRGKGWFNESENHAKAAKGKKVRPQGNNPSKPTEQMKLTDIEEIGPEKEDSKKLDDYSKYDVNEKAVERLDLEGRDPWSLNDSQWLKIHGSKRFVIFGEYSPMQWNNMSDRQQKRIKEKEDKESKKRGELLKEFDYICYRAWKRGEDNLSDEALERAKKVERYTVREAHKKALKEKRDREVRKGTTLKKTDFDGRSLKKLDNIESAGQKYHNKHVDGSGNFAYVITGEDGKRYELHADYSPDKELKNVQFGGGMHDLEKIDRKLKSKEDIDKLVEEKEGSEGRKEL